MWYIIARTVLNGLHIIACSGVFVNDLHRFYKKTSLCNKKNSSQIDRFYKTNKDRSKNYVFFEKDKFITGCVSHCCHELRYALQHNFDYVEMSLHIISIMFAGIFFCCGV